MNEFTGKSVAELKIIAINLQSYLTGCIDTFKLINELHLKTVVFYEEKIKSYHEAIKEKTKNEKI